MLFGKKPKPVDLKVGDHFETVFWRNEGAQQEAFPFRATHIGEAKSSKVILCADRSIALGKPARVKVTRIKRPQSDGRGFIEVEYQGPVDFQIDPEIWVEKNVAVKLQVLLEGGYSILLDGPQGSGKTVLSRAIADALEMEYVYFNCASVYEATDFIATLQVRANADGVAETVFVATNFRQALMDALAKPQNRYLVFLDEFNRCRPSARNGLMPALDTTRKVYDPETGDLLDIPGNIQFVAAINNGDQFVGTSSVDPAQMDRFATLKLDYPPLEAEVKILAGRFPAVDRKIIEIVVNVANKIRHDDAIGADLSLRATQEACAMLGHPLFSDEMKPVDALREALATAFCGRFPGRIEDEASEAGQIWSLVIKGLKEYRLFGMT
jgi:nitric oxide reductase NorQ protein